MTNCLLRRISSLAYAELRIVLAIINRRLDFSLFETTAEDVILQHDLVTANAKMDSKGVRVIVR